MASQSLILCERIDASYSFTAPVGIEAQIAIAPQDIRDQVIGH